MVAGLGWLSFGIDGGGVGISGGAGLEAEVDACTFTLVGGFVVEAAVGGSFLACFCGRNSAW